MALLSTGICLDGRSSGLLLCHSHVEVGVLVGLCLPDVVHLGLEVLEAIKVVGQFSDASVSWSSRGGTHHWGKLVLVLALALVFPSFSCSSLLLPSCCHQCVTISSTTSPWDGSASAVLRSTKDSDRALLMTRRCRHISVIVIHERISVKIFAYRFGSICVRRRRVLRKVRTETRRQEPERGKLDFVRR